MLLAVLWQGLFCDPHQRWILGSPTIESWLDDADGSRDAGYLGLGLGNQHWHPPNHILAAVWAACRFSSVAWKLSSRTQMSHPIHWGSFFNLSLWNSVRRQSVAWEYKRVRLVWIGSSFVESATNRSIHLWSPSSLMWRSLILYQPFAANGLRICVPLSHHALVIWIIDRAFWVFKATERHNVLGICQRYHILMPVVLIPLTELLWRNHKQGNWTFLIFEVFLDGAISPTRLIFNKR